jgi:nucleoside-diphosphate-sugar epimerase
VPDKLNVVTGASGLLGSHIVAELVARGEAVRAVARPASNAAFLKQLGVDIVHAELGDVAALRRAVAGAAIVYHCAARVSDWGPWTGFDADIVQGTRHALGACQAEGVGRILYISSISVYGPNLPGVITEESPLAPVASLSRWDYYGRAKILAEAAARAHGNRATVIRPTWCYGPRDHAGIPRFIKNLRLGRASIIGPGDHPLNIMHVRDAASGAILAANHPQAAGQSYNLSGPGDVTQVQLINALTDGVGLPRLEKHVSVGLAMRGALLVEIIGRLICMRQPPRYTRRAVERIARTTQFSTDKARRELGWSPRVRFADGIQETLAWYRTFGGGA